MPEPDDPRHDADADVFALPATELLEAAGYELSERSRERASGDPSYVLENGRLHGSADLYGVQGVQRFAWLTFDHRARPPGLFGWEHSDASVWHWGENYRGSEAQTVYDLDRDCRTLLLALAQGMVLGGEQRGQFTMLAPDGDGYGRHGGHRDDEPSSGPLSAFDTAGLVDIRTLADAPYPPKPPPAAWRRALRRRFATGARGRRE